MPAGPVGHLWYQFLDKFARSRLRVGSPGFIATKVVLDEGVFGPIHVLGFFAYMTLAEGGSWQVCRSSSPVHSHFITGALARASCLAPMMGIAGPQKERVACMRC